MSTSPIRVVSELSGGFERGALHVEIAERHHVVVHLNAHSARSRVDEARLLAEEVQEVLRQVIIQEKRLLLVTVVVGGGWSSVAVRRD
jgi:hypothetical protein